MNWAWLAGFIDGEGSLAARPYTHLARNGKQYKGVHIYLNISQKEPAILLEIKAFLERKGCRIVRMMDYVSGFGRVQWRLAVTNAHDLRIILRGILRHLCIKRARALAIVAVVRARPDRLRLAPGQEAVCSQCGRKSFYVQAGNLCRRCYMKRWRIAR